MVQPLGLVAALCAAALAQGALLSKRHEAAKRHEALGGLLSGKHRSGAPRRNETGVVAAAWAAVQDLVASRPAPKPRAPRAPAPARLRACVVERLPSSVFRPDRWRRWRAADLGSGRVVWRELYVAPHSFGTWTTRDGVLSYGAHDDQARARCDAVFWQVDDAREAAAARRAVGARHAPRLVFALRREDCARGDWAKHGIGFVWYAAPRDLPARPIRLPLGPAQSFAAPASRREWRAALAPPRYLFNFVATLGTHPARGAWLAAALAARDAANGTCTYVRAHREWENPARMFDATVGGVCECPRAGAPCDSEGGEAEGRLAPTEWRRVASASAFTFAPPGHNAETYRLYEAAEAGSIPVVSVSAETAFVTSDGFNQSRCGRAAQLKVFEGAPVLVAADPMEALPEMLKLWNDPPALLERRLSARAWARDQLATATRRAEAALAAAAAAAAAPRAAMPLLAGAPNEMRRWVHKVGVEEVDAGWIVLPFHSPVVHIVTDPLAALLHAPPLFRAQDVRGLPRFAEALAAPQSTGALSVRGRSSSMHLAALFWLEWHAQVGAAAAYTFRLEDPDGVAVLAALGVSLKTTRWPPGGLRGALRNYTTEAPRLSWHAVVAALGPALAGEVRTRAEALGYRYDSLDRLQNTTGILTEQEEGP